jgi:hypothetical protein
MFLYILRYVQANHALRSNFDRRQISHFFRFIKSCLFDMHVDPHSTIPAEMEDILPQAPTSSPSTSKTRRVVNDKDTVDDVLLEIITKHAAKSFRNLYLKINHLCLVLHLSVFLSFLIITRSKHADRMLVKLFDNSLHTLVHRKRRLSVRLHVCLS